MKKLKTIRWTAERAACELNHDRKTISKRLKAAGEQPGKDGKFSTRQIIDAVYGSYERERIRLLTAQADAAEDDRARQRGKLMPCATVLREWSQTVLHVRQRLLGLPAKLGSRILGFRSEAEIETVLRVEIEECLLALSDARNYGPALAASNGKADSPAPLAGTAAAEEPQ